jgi:hypothetical protein
MPGSKSRQSFAAIRRSRQTFTKFKALPPTPPPSPRLLEALRVANGDANQVRQDEAMARYVEASTDSTRRTGDLSPEEASRRAADSIPDGALSASSRRSENLFSEEASRRVGNLFPSQAPRRSGGGDGVANPVDFSNHNRAIPRADGLANPVDFSSNDGEIPLASTFTGSFERSYCDGLANPVDFSTHGRGRISGSKSAQELNSIGAAEKQQKTDISSSHYHGYSPVGIQRASVKGRDPSSSFALSEMRDKERDNPTKAAGEGHELRQSVLGSSDLSVEMPALVEDSSNREISQLMVDRMSRARDFRGASSDEEGRGDEEETERNEGMTYGVFSPGASSEEGDSREENYSSRSRSDHEHDDLDSASSSDNEADGPPR